MIERGSIVKMADDIGEIKTWNPMKDMSKEITLEILIRHRDAMKQARTGELVDVKVESLGDNNRRFNQVRALNLIISAQREMITVSRPIISFRSKRQWMKDNKTVEEQQKNPFNESLDDIDKIKYDYNKLKFWLGFLSSCTQEIIKAEKTKIIDDDFMIRKMVDGEESYELTENFYDMLEDLEDSYEQINLLMLTNKIISAGIEEDEELTYKELETETIRRIVEA